MHVVIFEDGRWPMFAPVSLSRPVFSLASGTSTLMDKQIRALKPSRVSLWVRPELVDFCRRHVLPTFKIPVTLNEPLNEEPALLINGRTLICGTCELPKRQSVSVDEHGICAAYVESSGLSFQNVFDDSPAWLELRNLPAAVPIGQTAAYVWDLITWNEVSLLDDASNLPPPAMPRAAGPYHLLNDTAIFLGQNVKLSPGCVIDASKGPVIVGDNATIGANAVIFGPCSIGAGSTISPLALIRGGTSVGALCKIGGEVSNTIFMSCSNKAHEGFVGDSYVGQWVNFGAGASTSNLKNTYGSISIRMGRETIATGKQFLGALVGDHCKFAIFTRLMTGSYIGYCSMVAASSLTPTFLRSFTFLSDRGAEWYNRDKARQMMTQVFSRRGREWEAGDEDLMQYAAAVSERLEN